MKRVLFGLFLAVALCSFVGCPAPDDTDYETLREKCRNHPSLPECQDDVEEDNSDSDN